MQYLIIRLSIILLLCGSIIGQVPDTIWSKIQDITNDIDEGKCVRKTIDGGYIITGSCVSDGMNSFADVLLFKTDSNGNIQWTKIYDRSFFEEGLSVGLSSDGGYIVGGRCLTGSYPFIEPPVSDAWILKTDANGDTLWSKIYGGSGNDYCTSILQTSDDGYIIGGTTNSEMNYPCWEINEDFEPDSARAWLIKTDVNGNIQWANTYLVRSHGNCVIQASGGGYIITGCVFPDPQSNQSDVLLIKTDANGEMIWSKIIGGSGYNVAFSVRETTDGYVIAGQTKAVGAPFNAYDALIIKTNLSGEVIWNKTIIGQWSNAAFSVDVSDNGYYFSGSTNGNWWITAMSDMWIFKTDNNGNILWERIYDIRSTDILFSGTLCMNGGFVVTGMTSFGFGGDLWLAKLDSEPTDVNNKSSTPAKYVLYQNYPNPFNPSTTISYSLPKAAHITLKIYNVLGRDIQTLVDEYIQAGQYSIKFDAKGLSGGIYFYSLQIGSDFVSTKKMTFIR